VLTAIPRTVFLDRDGTLNVKASDGGYITDPADLVLLPGAAAAVRMLNERGLKVVLVTNQRCIARGMASAADVRRVNDRLVRQLEMAGARLTACYVCPHDILAGCGCRKPAPGLLLRAAAEDPAIDLREAVMIGDAESDVAAGRAAGTATIRLARRGTPSLADRVRPTLADAVRELIHA
jgi:D-glycero-D-manno-heptose 1,7-bisphosphate phosphatase